MGHARDSSPELVEQMKRQSYILVTELQNFVHRRDQTILHKELPPKTEYVLYIRMNDFQVCCICVYGQVIWTEKYVQRLFEMQSRIEFCQEHLVLCSHVTKDCKPSGFGANVF